MEIVPRSHRISLYLSPHCSSGNCNYCRTRRERRRAQSIRDIIATSKLSTCPDPWATPIRPRYAAPEIPTVQATPYPSVTPKQVYYLKDKTSRNPKHRPTPKHWRSA